MNYLNGMRRRLGFYGETERANIAGAAQPSGNYKKITSNFNQWIRMREDKLKSMKKALYFSYQAAIVQKYNPLEAEDAQTAPYFRCLINHDKLKVAYEDKILSIPFEENSVNIDPIVTDNQDMIETDFSNGTVFKWIHGNKEKWTPDSYWIVYLQYSEETAYFRAEIRKADEKIIVTTEDGKELVYRGWTSGPDEQTIEWNVKSGIVWNDMNYTKLLYITKDETTSAFFKRFDRIKVNNKWWEVQAFNDSYGVTSKNKKGGMIRVALKETYTSTDEMIKDMNSKEPETPSPPTTEPTIRGKDILYPGDSTSYTFENLNIQDATVELVPDGTGKKLNQILSWKIVDNKLQIEVISMKKYKKGFNIKCGDTIKHVTIESL